MPALETLPRTIEDNGKYIVEKVHTTEYPFQVRKRGTSADIGIARFMYVGDAIVFAHISAYAEPD